MRRKILLTGILLGCYMAAFAANPEVLRRTLYYRSVDQNGDSLTLSGAVSVPASKDAKGVILVTHYTIAAKDEAPSVKPTSEAKYLAEDYVLLMPDYIGYGATADRIHPYLHGELTATNCVDMLFAARPLLDTMDLDVSLDSIYLMGYSQGGASAIWTLKKLEEEYRDRVYVKHCFVGAGPYDVAATYDEAIRTNKVGSPLVIPMLVEGTNESYNLGLDRSFFYTKAMERKYNKYIKDKEYGVVEIFFLTLNHRVSHWLTKEGMDKTLPMTRKLYDGLVRSSIVGEHVHYDWEPESNLYVFHSYKDDIVTFRCAEHLQQRYPERENITYDFGNYGSHLKASGIFYSKVQQMLRELNP